MGFSESSPSGAQKSIHFPCLCHKEESNKKNDNGLKWGVTIRNRSIFFFFAVSSFGYPKRRPWAQKQSLKASPEFAPSPKVSVKTAAGGFRSADVGKALLTGAFCAFPRKPPVCCGCRAPRYCAISTRTPAPRSACLGGVSSQNTWYLRLTLFINKVMQDTTKPRLVASPN